MAKTFTAQLMEFEEKTNDQQDRIIKASLQDVIKGAQFDCPVDTGFLKNSLVSELNGSKISEGSESYVLAIASHEIGDIARFAWTAGYGIYQELGWGGRSGRHFVGRNAARWPQIVEENARMVQ